MHYSPHRKIFVVGCPRSGTSWAAEMLAQHPDIVKLPGESHLYKLFYDPFTYLEKLNWQARIKKRVWIYKNFGITPIVTGFNSHNIWASLPRIYRFYQRSGQYSGPHMCVSYEKFLGLVEQAKAGAGDDLEKVSRLIKSVLEVSFLEQGGDRHQIMLEKTPMHVKYSDVILKSFPEAKVVEIVRDVRGVCASWQARAKTQSWAAKPTHQLVKQWARSLEVTEKCKQDAAMSDRILSIRYEDLRQNTTASLSKAFDFAGVTTHPSAVHTIAEAFNINKVKNKGEGQHIRKGAIDAWKEELSAADIELCQRSAGPLLEKLGYQVQ